MAEYLSPGVYVEEVDRGPKPIEGVGTAMAVFVGFTEKAQLAETINGETITHDLLGKAQLVTNWSQYAERFGGFAEGAYLPHSVYGYFQNGGTRCYVLSIKTIPKAQALLLNGEGKPQLVVRAKQAGFDGLKLRVRVDTPAALAAPEKKGKAAKDAAPAEGGEAASEGSSGGTFTLTVEKEKTTGGWATLETREASLTDVALEDGSKKSGRRIQG